MLLNMFDCCYFLQYIFAKQPYSSPSHLKLHDVQKAVFWGHVNTFYTCLQPSMCLESCAKTDVNKQGAFQPITILVT